MLSLFYSLSLCDPRHFNYESGCVDLLPIKYFSNISDLWSNTAENVRECNIGSHASNKKERWRLLRKQRSVSISGVSLVWGSQSESRQVDESVSKADEDPVIDHNYINQMAEIEFEPFPQLLRGLCNQQNGLAQSATIGINIWIKLWKIRQHSIHNVIRQPDLGSNRRI